MSLLLLILMLLAGISAGMFTFIETRNHLIAERIDEAVRIRIKKDFVILNELLEAYRQLNGGYPSTAQGLKALAVKPAAPPPPPRWQALIREEGLLDPWGRTYQYASPGQQNEATYDMWSVGGDVDDPADDIGNW